MRATPLIERGPVEPAAAVTLADSEWTYLEAQFEIDKHSDWPEERAPVTRHLDSRVIAVEPAELAR